MTTKLELQQINTRLAADNKYLREKNSALSTDWATAVNQCTAQQTEIAFLRATLAERDHLARKLIASNNRKSVAILNAFGGNAPTRREAMQEARNLAIASGKVVKANHV